MEREINPCEHHLSNTTLSHHCIPKGITGKKFFRFTVCSKCSGVWYRTLPTGWVDTKEVVKVLKSMIK